MSKGRMAAYWGKWDKYCICMCYKGVERLDMLDNV